MEYTTMYLACMWHNPQIREAQIYKETPKSVWDREYGRVSRINGDKGYFHTVEEARAFLRETIQDRIDRTVQEIGLKQQALDLCRAWLQNVDSITPGPSFFS